MKVDTDNLIEALNYEDLYMLTGKGLARLQELARRGCADHHFRDLAFIDDPFADNYEIRNAFEALEARLVWVHE